MVVYSSKQMISDPAKLGEGPLWDADSQTLYYVDIEGKAVRHFFPQTGKLSIHQMDGMTGCIVPVGGGLIAAVHNRLIRLNSECQPVQLLEQLPLDTLFRFNDGKCDPSGRLWVGVMAADQTHPAAKQGGGLYRFEDKKAAVQLLDRLTIPNGLAWNAAQTVFYHIDTPTGAVFAYDYDADSGSIANRRTVIEIPAEEGSPDGMCIDIQGMLWIALWNGYKVVRYDPNTGKRLAEVSVPAKFVSCCTFGGENLDELYITTAMDENGQGGEVYWAQTEVQGTLPYDYRLKY